MRFLTLFLPVMLLLGSTHYKARSQNAEVQIEGKLRTSPEATGSIISTISAGSTVELLSKSGLYYRLKYGYLDGWMHTMHFNSANLIRKKPSHSTNSDKKWNTGTKTYRGGILLSGIIILGDINPKVHSLEPMGKDVIIVHDIFFDKYTVDFTNSDGGRTRFIFEPVGKLAEGKQYYEDTYGPEPHERFFIDRSGDLTAGGNMIATLMLPVNIEGQDVKLLYFFEDFKY
jgi:hypothetical protein